MAKRGRLITMPPAPGGHKTGQNTPPMAQPRIEDELRRTVQANGSQKAAAHVLGISPQYLSDLLKGRREISAKVATALGFQRIVSYLRKP